MDELLLFIIECVAVVYVELTLCSSLSDKKAKTSRVTICHLAPSMSKKAVDDSCVLQLPVECVHSSHLGVKSHVYSVGIVLHAGGGPAYSKLPGNNGATTLENRDLKSRQTASH